VKPFLKEFGKNLEKDLYDFIEKLEEKIQNRINSKELKVGIIHGDLFIDNTIFDGENLLAIIDFEDVTETEVILDIAMTILGCCYEEDQFNEECYQSFLKGYEMKRKIPTEERELLPIYLLYAMLTVLIWRYKKWNLDSNSEERLKERYKIMKKAIDNFNEKLIF